MDDNKLSEHEEKLLREEYSYPEPDDPDFQLKIFRKREYNIHEYPERPEAKTYQEIEEHRNNICGRHFTLHEHQASLANFINPDTPNKGIIVFHGLGSGKCIGKDSIVRVIDDDHNDYNNSIEIIWEKFCSGVETISDGSEISIPLTSLYIKSYNEKMKRYEYRQIEFLYREYINSFVKEIILENGSEIKLTGIHKLLTSGGWTNNFSENDCVMTDYGKFVKIKKIKQIEYHDYVYDFTVPTTHNFVSNGILCHNTCVGVAIAERFKPLVQKYNTKIFILVPGALLKNSWKKHLIKCTGETYLKYHDKSKVISQVEQQKMEKNALVTALNNYKIMSHRSFYKHVLGERIKTTDKVVNGSKVKTAYRKTDEGEFERDISTDRIHNLNNTVIIVDEAHNLTGNNYGLALTQIIKNSVNLKIVLLTATPMKNLADDIIPLLNFIRPEDSQIERNKIFNNYDNYMMDFREGGQAYLKKMLNGYVSHIRGADPITYAKRVDKGIIPKGLKFTNLIRCEMLDFQKSIYEVAIKYEDDRLDRRVQAVANVVFPKLSKNKTIIGCYGKQGIYDVLRQLRENSDLLNEKIGNELFENSSENDWIFPSADGKTISGRIFKMPYLKYFSTKFYKVMKKLNRLVIGKKGPQTAFIYSNLVEIGIRPFQEILIQNGYLEYQESHTNYQINNDTVCYYCGKTYSEHKSNRLSRESTDDYDLEIETDDNIQVKKHQDDDLEKMTLHKSEIKRSDSSSDYEPYKNKNTRLNNAHDFYPATFLTVTGKSNDESSDVIPEEKVLVLDNVFSHIDNRHGKYLKFVLGSKVMNEGTNLKNVGEAHILDIHFNLGKVDQAIGRAIRWCSHYNLMSEENPYPFVNVYKYVVSFKDNKLSAEEELYRKAELKYLLIKKVERIMKESAFDCPLNLNVNIFREEMSKYKDCGKEGNMPCPVECDYTNCHYKCDNEKLNSEYYDPNRMIYKRLSKDQIDYSTFNSSLQKSEIDYVKDKIKEMYIRGHKYTVHEVLDYVKKSYSQKKQELFDEFFVYKALYELLPTTENDFNNFKDTIIDDQNQQGYLIYIDGYYIFQPFDQNENVEMYYRKNKQLEFYQELSLYNYLKRSDVYKNIKNVKHKKLDNEITSEYKTYYNFDDTLDYYDNRDEFDYVGFIDKDVGRGKKLNIDEMEDVFKIREKRAKILEKKRGTGIPSLKGAVCSTSKSREYLQKIYEDILNISKNNKIKIPKFDTRTELCNAIKETMLYNERFSTAKNKNKFTYIMIPKNHPEYPFPLNLEDRVDYILNEIKNIIKFAITENITKTDYNDKNGNKCHKYTITIKDESKLQNYSELLKKNGGKLVKNNWIINVE